MVNDEPLSFLIVVKLAVFPVFSIVPPEIVTVPDALLLYTVSAPDAVIVPESISTFPVPSFLIAFPEPDCLTVAPFIVKFPLEL